MCANVYRMAICTYKYTKYIHKREEEETERERERRKIKCPYSHRTLFLALNIVPRNNLLFVIVVSIAVASAHIHIR